MNTSPIRTVRRRRKITKDSLIYKSEKKNKTTGPTASTVRPRKSDVWPNDLSKIWINEEEELSDSIEFCNERKRMRLLSMSHINENCTMLDEYIKTGKSNFSIKEYPLVVIEKSNSKNAYMQNFALVINSILYSIRASYVTEGNETEFEIFLSEVESGEKIPFAAIKDKQLIINGDDEEGISPDVNMNVFSAFKDSPTVSFLALALLLDYISDPENDIDPYGENDFIRDAAYEITTKRMNLIEFTPDQKLPETRKEVLKGFNDAKRKKGKINGTTHRKNFLNNMTPPSPGFTLMDTSHGKLQWHRASTCLFSYRKNASSKKLQHWIIGMDEGTYFGCVLKDNVKSIEEAFDSLMPKEAKNSTNYLRQGEWFAVPVDEKDVPSLLDSVYFGDGDCSICLPVQDKDSNRHVVCLGDSSGSYNSISGGEFRISKKGILFAKGFTVVHRQTPENGGHDTNEHQNMNTKLKNQWYSFYENTALRSVSLGNGVD